MAVSDVCIVGGGQAGLAAGIALRRKGCSVTVFDAAAPSADKACGERLMPDALAALSDLGIEIGAMESFPFRGIRFHDRSKALMARFPVGTGRGVRRTTLHGVLAEHTESMGVSLKWARIPILPGCVVDGSSAPMVRTRWFANGQGRIGAGMTGGALAFGGTTGSSRGPTAWSCTGLPVTRST